MFWKLIIIRDKPWIILVGLVLVAITIPIDTIKRLFIFRKGMVLRWAWDKKYLPVLWRWRDMTPLRCPLLRKRL